MVGADLTIEQGYQAASYAALTSLAAVKYALGDLDRVSQILRVIGYVNAVPGFSHPPRVINGATDLLVEIYGERGAGTRAAIGCQGIANNSSVKVILEVLFDGESVRTPLQTVSLKRDSYRNSPQ